MSLIDLQTISDIRLDCFGFWSVSPGYLSSTGGELGRGSGHGLAPLMDAFEQLAADIFWAEGYWVRTGVKVELTREEKQRIGRSSSPRWEIDLVAYSPARGELLAVECKSYIDSGGVHAAHFEPGSRYAHRYKLFHDPVLRETILGALAAMFVRSGLCPPDVTVRLALACAHATDFNHDRLVPLFAERGWLLFDPPWFLERLSAMAAGGYENSTAAIVSKLLLRNPHRGDRFVVKASDLVLCKAPTQPEAADGANQL